VKVPGWVAVALAILAGSCIAPSVLTKNDRAISLGVEDITWRAATEADVPGVYVSMEMSGPLAATLRKVVYLFEAEGTYTGAGLIDDDPPHFEVIGGSWHMEEDGLHLDDAAPATIEAGDDGSLRLSGTEGRIILRRERNR